MMTITPGEIPHREMHQILLSGVAPRPIALVATSDAEGNINLSPFSFFNAYSSKPPIVAIGPAHSAKTYKAKDTYLNLLDTGFCTINAVTFSMVEQVNLASCEYEKGVDEFQKSGLTKRPSELIQVPGVLESPFIMECKLISCIPLGREIKGNGNILLCQALKIHISQDVLTDGKIDPRKMDLVARMGYNWYSRVTPESIFEVHKPTWNGIGMDRLPEELRHSSVLSGNDLAKLAGVKDIPQKNSQTAQGFASIEERHRAAKQLLLENRVEEAWQLLL